MIEGIAFLKFMIFLLTIIWWGEHDAKVQDKAHREKQLEFGIGTNKTTRVWLRGLLIAALSLSNTPEYTVMVFTSLSLLWIPLFNPWLAYSRKYNDDTPELGNTGIDGWFLKRPTFYKVFKVLSILIGITLYVLAHSFFFFT
jgi:hypothetical protein